MKRVASLCLIGLLAACSSSTGDTAGIANGVTSQAVVAQYGKLVKTNYDESLAQMKLLQTAVHALVDAPSDANLQAAKAAWTAARPSYLQTEGFRFYNGPIDNEDTGPEGMINSWPIDENFVDYVIGDAAAGIINQKDGAAFTFAEISKEVIADQNENGGEKNLSAGWHVIEFLLWGQDLLPDGTPNNAGTGARPWSDYQDGGSAANQDRRRAYLASATDLMVEQFAAVVVQWDLADANSYGAKMVAGDSSLAIGNMLKGIGSLAATELPKERMNNAYETKEQEEEHSCFSDTTTQDLSNNARSIQNVYLGRYGTVSGASISDLVRAKDATLDAKITADIADAVAKTDAIPHPFDTAILGDDTAPGRVAVKAAIDAWSVVVKADIVAASTALNVTINLSNDQ